MSAHFVHQYKCNKQTTHCGSPLQTTPTTSQVLHLDRPHTSGPSSIVTPTEMFLLVISILTLLALVIWLAWIALLRCIKLVKGKLDDMTVGQQTKKNAKRAKEAPKKAFKYGIDAGRTAKEFFDGFMRGERDPETRRQDERRSLLRHDSYEERVVTGIPRGVLIQGYGYDRERYGDGTNDSSSHRSTSVSVGHREDCDGMCGVTTRRRSVY
jgi:hypothetical protein